MSNNMQSQAAVKSLVDALVTGWNRHDAAAFSQPFASDADFTNVFGMRARGREEIAQFHAPIFATMFKESKLTALDTAVRFLRPDIAAVDLQWSMIGARDPHGNEWPIRHGLMSLVVTRAGDDWSIAVMHNMDLPSEELAKAQAQLQGRPQ